MAVVDSVLPSWVSPLRASGVSGVVSTILSIRWGPAAKEYISMIAGAAMSITARKRVLPSSTRRMPILRSTILLEKRGTCSPPQQEIRYSGSSHAKTPAGLKEVTSEDGRDRKFENVLNEFYDEVVAAVRGAEAIQIFGPGEAKGELEKRLERAGLKEHVLAIEAADKMTDRQIAAKVRKRFQS